MSSAQLYPVISAHDPCSSGGGLCTDNDPATWYTPVSVPYNNPYMTPFLSSYDTFPNLVAEQAPWFPQSRLTNPDFVTGYNVQPPVLTSNVHPIERPHSSPSTFGPAAENISWPDNALGIRYNVPDPPTSLGSNFPEVSYDAPQQGVKSTTSSPASTQALETSRYYPPLAPNPAGLAAKRRQEDEEEAALQSSFKRRRRTPSASTISDTERFLFTLKEDESLPWKEIKARFESDLGEVASIPTLQMRYKRAREKVRAWEAKDVEALFLAHEYYEKKKWEIISEEMLKYGIMEQWPARYCARKWSELAAQQPPPAAQTPGPSQYSSPAEASSRFGYYTL
ncbi:hypothetical protein MBLNU459_g4326t1 [Dothideomycetes sp. NU459]